MATSIEDHLKTLADQPSNNEAKRAISGIARRKVAAQLFDERQDLSMIAKEILEENGTRLTTEMRERLVPIVRSLVDGVMNDDEPTGVTELLQDWGETGHVDEEHLYDALQVALGKRLRWVLNKPQYGSLRHKISPGELMGELFIKLNQYGIPRLLENRKQFFAYSETVLKNLLIDMQRADLRKGRPITRDKQPLENLLRVLDAGGVGGGQVNLAPEEWLDVREAVDLLPEDLREAIRHRYLWDWKPKEIQNELGIPKSTLTRRLSLGLAALRENFIKDGQQPPTG